MFVDKLQAAGLPASIRSGRHLVAHTIAGVEHQFALPITFTPFASAQACSARCTFCSETMVHKNTTRLSASLRPDHQYFEGLAKVLAELDGLPVGVSLSGLESTDNKEWLFAVLDQLQKHGQTRPDNIHDRILYTNGNGICLHGLPMVHRLSSFNLTRAEMSRHHWTAERNQNIMRFKTGMPALDQERWQNAVRLSKDFVPVRLVCIVQKGGVDSVAEILNYLGWAHTQLGVTDVVFREFSNPSDLYKNNATLRRIRADRISVDSLLASIFSADQANQFEPVKIEHGYYYWNVTMRWRGQVDVTFEASDYGAMKEKHQSDVVYKLIYHANGNLSSDWDPNTCVLMQTMRGSDSPKMS